MNFELGQDHLVLQESVRDFVDNEIKPIAIQIDESHSIPTELVDMIG